MPSGLFSEQTNLERIRGLMENGVGESEATSRMTIKSILSLLMESVVPREDGDGDAGERKKKSVISLGLGNPSAYSCFKPPDIAIRALFHTLRSNTFNGYSPTASLPQARRVIAKYLSNYLPYDISPDDVFVTSGCTQAIDVAMSLLARPGANILLPRPGFPIYNLSAALRHLQVREYDLLPDKGWEVDVDGMKSLADRNTVAIVIINPGNPCGNVYSEQHLNQIAETAQKLKTMIIADEVYGHLAFGATPFILMGRYGSIVPVLTLGSLSKRWILPGWRLGWFVTADPNGMFRIPKVVERIKSYFELLGGPATFIQAAIPRIIEQTDETFFEEIISILKRCSGICYNRIKDIPCLTCPMKPEGSMTMMIKLSLSLLENISSDVDFCFKLAKEESVIILPGFAVGMKDWIRITFAGDPSSIEEAMGRIKSFCSRHTKREDLHFSSDGVISK